MTEPDHTATDQALAAYEAAVAAGASTEAATLAGVQAQLAAEQAKDNQDQLEIASLQDTVVSLKAQIAALQGGTPPPPPSKVLYGSDGAIGSNPAAVAAADAKWGTTTPVFRWFDPGPPSVVPDTKHQYVMSCKTLNPSLMATNYANAFRSVYVHEIDSKVHKGQMTAAQWQSDMAKLVAAKVPNLCVILTAYCFVTGNPEDYVVPGVKHFGVDLDGISGWPYHDYTREIGLVKAYCAKHGMDWGVGELGANQAPQDPNDTFRGGWLVKTAQQAAAAGASWVCLWEYSGQSGSELKQAASIGAWQALVRS